MLKQTLKTSGLLHGACAVVMLAGGCARGSAQEFKGFPDVPKDHWAAQAVNDLARRGILQGYPGEPSGGKLRVKPQTQSKPAAQAQTKAQAGRPSGARRSSPAKAGSGQQK